MDRYLIGISCSGACGNKDCPRCNGASPIDPGKLAASEPRCTCGESKEPCPVHEIGLIQDTDTEAVFKEKFASSLESQANAMDEAIEAFVDYKDVQGNLMACRSWLRRTAKSIREM